MRLHLPGRTRSYGVALVFLAAACSDRPSNPVGALQPDAPPGTVELFSQMGVAGVLEVFGGMLIVLGLFTRPVAFIRAGQMAVAYFQFHAPQAFFPTTNGGIPAIMYCFFFLYLVFAGAGEWSVDAAIARSRRRGVSKS